MRAEEYKELQSSRESVRVRDRQTEREIETARQKERVRESGILKETLCESGRQKER